MTAPDPVQQTLHHELQIADQLLALLREQTAAADASAEQAELDLDGSDGEAALKRFRLHRKAASLYGKARADVRDHRNWLLGKLHDLQRNAS